MYGRSLRHRSSARRCGRGATCSKRVLERSAMKVTYDERTDTLTVILKEGVAVAESDEDKPGVILDYDERGDLVSLEILDASKRVTEARRVEFQTTS